MPIALGYPDERYRRDGIQGRKEAEMDKRTMSRRSFVGAGGLSAAALGMLLAGCGTTQQQSSSSNQADTAKSDSLVAKTAYGPVKGTNEDRVNIWYGVPYGKSPEGELRWQAPEESKPGRPWLACAAVSAAHHHTESHERNSISSAAYAIFCCPQPAGTRMHSGQHIAASGRGWRRKGCCGHKISWSCIGMLPEFAVSASASRPCYHISE